MANDSDRSHRELAHFHACVHCGSIYQKEDFDGRTIATGIYPCSKCGLEGPLNIVIQPSGNSTGGVGRSANDRSAT